MKAFAFPISVKYENSNQRHEIMKILCNLGYSFYEPIRTSIGTVVTKVKNHNNRNNGKSDSECSMCILHGHIANEDIYDNDRYHIDHFNPELIRDIAAACTNDTWQEGELWVSARGKLSRVIGCAGFVVNPNGHRRPTLAEICEHHGYEIKGKCIVKKAPLSAKAPILFDLDKCEFVSIDQIVTNGVSLEHHIDVEIRLKKALKTIEDLKHEITAWETKYENIKQVVNR